MAQYLQDLSIRNCIPQFIYKLYGILMMQKHMDAICWSNNQICIKDAKKMQGVLGEYFRHTRLDSFIRQLNMYGFNKVVKLGQKNQLFFVNQYFKKGHVDDMVMIKRKRKNKGEGEIEGGEVEKYRNFIQGNVQVLFDNVQELRNNNPGIAQDFNRIMSILGEIIGKGTAATISEENKGDGMDFMLDRESVCSIEREFTKI